LNTIATNITTTLGVLGLASTPIIAAGATVPTEQNAFIGYLVLTGLNLAVSVSSIATGIVMRKAAGRPLELRQPVLTELKKDMATREDIAAQHRFTGHVRDELGKLLKEHADEDRQERRRIFAKLDTLGHAHATLENEASNLREAVRELNRKISL
jgi:hypothetical protein